MSNKKYFVKYPDEWQIATILPLNLDLKKPKSISDCR